MNLLHQHRAHPVPGVNMVGQCRDHTAAQLLIVVVSFLVLIAIVARHDVLAVLPRRASKVLLQPFEAIGRRPRVPHRGERRPQLLQGFIRIFDQKFRRTPVGDGHLHILATSARQVHLGRVNFVVRVQRIVILHVANESGSGGDHFYLLVESLVLFE